MKNSESSNIFDRVWFMGIVLLSPALVFYAILWKTSCNIPITDDYSLLDFTNRWAQLHGLLRLLLILTYQHNEYKLMLENAVVAMQYSVLGHVSFSALTVLGNAFILALFVLLVFIYRAPRQLRGSRLLLLLPVSLLLFQLQYAVTLNWSMAALQNITVIFFSLLAICLLCQRTNSAFSLAILAMLLAIASSGNGFIASFVGCILLITQKRWWQTACWIISTMIAIAIYAFHYNPHVYQAMPGASVTTAPLHINPLYALAFMGASIARYQSYLPAIFLGAVLCGVFLFAVRRRYDLQNPAVFYSIFFILITAIGVSGLRGQFGVTQSLASRYRIYSNLLLILCYMFLTEAELPKIESGARRRFTLATVVVICLAFCGISDRAGSQFLRGRRNAVMQIMARWEYPHSSHVTTNTVENDPVLKRQLDIGLYDVDSSILLESIRLGVFKPQPLNTP